MRGDADSSMADTGCGAEQDHMLLCGELRCRLCHGLLPASACPLCGRGRRWRLRRLWRQDGNNLFPLMAGLGAALADLSPTFCLGEWKTLMMRATKAPSANT